MVSYRTYQVWYNTYYRCTKHQYCCLLYNTSRYICTRIYAITYKYDTRMTHITCTLERYTPSIILLTHHVLAVCSRLLTSAHVCSRLLTSAHVLCLYEIRNTVKLTEYGLQLFTEQKDIEKFVQTIPGVYPSLHRTAKDGEWPQFLEWPDRKRATQWRDGKWRHVTAKPGDTTNYPPFHQKKTANMLE